MNRAVVDKVKEAQAVQYQKHRSLKTRGPWRSSLFPMDIIVFPFNKESLGREWEWE